MKAVELTKNEREVLVAIVANAKKVGDSGIEFILQDVAEATGKNIRSVSATTGSLAKKGMLLTASFPKENTYGQLMTSITRMKKELGYQRKTFGNVVQNKNGKQDGE